MEDRNERPLYDNAQKVRLMEWVHKTLYENWFLTIPLSAVFEEAAEKLRSVEAVHREAEGKSIFRPPYLPEWFVWDGDGEEFLHHLVEVGVPGCTLFDCAQTVKRYVEECFGENAFRHLNEAVKEGDFISFSDHLYAAHAAKLVRKHIQFPIPQELESLALEAIRHRRNPSQEIPMPSGAPALLQTDPGTPQGTLF